MRDLSLEGVFPEVELDAWREAAGGGLKGRGGARSVEGLGVETLFTAADLPRSSGYPGLPPFTRGRSPSPGGWEVCQQCADPDPGAAADRIASLLRQGVHAVWLRLDCPVRADVGGDAVSADGLVVWRLEDLEQALAPVDLVETRLRLHAGGNGVGVTALLVAAARARGVDPATLAGSVDIDPIGAVAADGELGAGVDDALQDMAQVAAWACRHAPYLQTVMVSSMPYHGGGASAVEEVALTLATAVEYLRVLTGAGMSLAQACGRMRVVVGVGRDLFLAVAKIRALRRLWSAVVRSSAGEASEQAIPVHAVCSPRSLAVRDPWVNLLRSTVETFAAAVAGADVITTWPFDSAIGQPGELATRLAANTQTILREECHLARVADPAGGSYYVERLTDDLARSAWALFQEIERRGGMTSSVLDGWVGRRLAATMSLRRQAVATRQEPITGVSSFANLAEQSLPRPTPDVGALRERQRAETDLSEQARRAVERLAVAARQQRGDELIELAAAAFEAGATVGEVAATTARASARQRCPRIGLEREATPFEALREASDRHQAETGRRPQAFIVALGPLAEHKPRSTFARDLLAAGGVETLADDGHGDVAGAVAAFAASGARLAVICASDERCREAVPSLAGALKEHGARSVVVAGRPGGAEQAWRAAGVDLFVSEGCDAVEVLGALHRAAEVGHD